MFFSTFQITFAFLFALVAFCSAAEEQQKPAENRNKRGLLAPFGYAAAYPYAAAPYAAAPYASPYAAYPYSYAPAAYSAPLAYSSVAAPIVAAPYAKAIAAPAYTPFAYYG